MMTDQRFAANSHPARHRPLVDEAVGQWPAWHEHGERLTIGRKSGVPVASIYPGADAQRWPAPAPDARTDKVLAALRTYA